MRSVHLPPVSHRGIATVEASPREHTVGPSNLVGGAETSSLQAHFRPVFIGESPGKRIPRFLLLPALGTWQGNCRHRPKQRPCRTRRPESPHAVERRPERRQGAGRQPAGRNRCGRRLLDRIGDRLIGADVMASPRGVADPRIRHAHGPPQVDQLALHAPVVAGFSLQDRRRQRGVTARRVSVREPLRQRRATARRVVRARSDRKTSALRQDAASALRARRPVRVREPRRRRHLRLGVPRECVAFGAEATHGGIRPVILGGRHRQGHGRTPFRMQFVRGLPRTMADDSCWQYTGRFLVSLKAATRLAGAASAIHDGCSATVRSERDGRQQFQLATGGVGPRRGPQICGSGRIGPHCASMPREGALGAGGQRGKPQPHPSLVEVDRVERPSRTRSPPRCAPRGADRAPRRGTA